MQSIRRFLHNRLSHFTLIIAWLWGFYTFKIRNRIKIIGRENLPRDTNALYLSNHETLIDSFLKGISVVSFRELIFYPKRIPWNAPDRSNFFSKKLGVLRYTMGLLRNIPTARNLRSREAIHAQLDQYIEALADGNLSLFFEGTRTRDGEIGQCKSGVAHIIQAAKPRYVIPILLVGIQPIMPIEAGFSFSKIQGGHRGHIIIGKPIKFSQAEIDQHGRKYIAAKVRQSVVELQEQL